ncbi:MAG: tRNA-dihydrouridine synthase family protein [Candidatus Woesearchaeota archaeon]
MLPRSIFKKGLFLAPMALYSDYGLRRLCFEYGADYTFTEMISAHTIVRKDLEKIRELDILDDEVPTGIQILTFSPEMLKGAIEKIQHSKISERISSVCLNLGCPNVRNNGAFLLNNLELIRKLFIAMETSKLPTSAKIRLAIDEKHLLEKPYLKIAELAEKHLDFLIVHGRTLSQRFSGRVNLDAIREIKESVSIPVVGNGDIKSGIEAGHMFKETGCDAVMIGRAAIRKPFIFKEIKHYLRTGSEIKIDEKQELLKCAVNYLNMQKQANFSAFQTRVHLQALLRRFKQLNRQISLERTVEGMRTAVLKEYNKL